MASIFTQIIAGDIPGFIIWEDEHAVLLLTIAPLMEGHVLLVPREEIDHWDDLPAELAAHLMTVSQKVAKVLKQTYQPQRVGLVLAGLEVPHTHVHLMPVNSLEDFDFNNAKMQEPERLAPVAEKLRPLMNF